MKKEPGWGQFSQALSGCRVSAWLHGQGGPNHSLGKTDDARKLPIIILQSQPRPVPAGSQVERAGRCQLRGTRQELVVYILLPTLCAEPGWQKLEMSHQATVCCWAMATHAMNPQYHQPSLAKQTSLLTVLSLAKRAAVKKGFHWSGRQAYAHGISDCRAAANWAIATFLRSVLSMFVVVSFGVVFFSLSVCFPSQICLISFFICS